MIKSIKRYFLKKKSKLLTFKNYSYVFEKNKKLINNNFVILARNNHFFYPRIGTIISKKNIKKSHERNRIKRLIKETFRLSQHKLTFMDFIVIAKKNSDLFKNNKLIVELQYLWYRYYR